MPWQLPWVRLLIWFGKVFNLIGCVFEMRFHFRINAPANAGAVLLCLFIIGFYQKIILG